MLVTKIFLLTTIFSFMWVFCTQGPRFRLEEMEEITLKKGAGLIAFGLSALSWIVYIILSFVTWGLYAFPIVMLVAEAAMIMIDQYADKSGKSRMRDSIPLIIYRAQTVLTIIVVTATIVNVIYSLLIGTYTFQTLADIFCYWLR